MSLRIVTRVALQIEQMRENARLQLFQSNMLLPISALPSELFVEIVKLATAAQKPQRSMVCQAEMPPGSVVSEDDSHPHCVFPVKGSTHYKLNVLRTVCKLWSQFISDTPSLWSTIDVRFPGAAETCLKRSQNANLTVLCDFNDHWCDIPGVRTHAFHGQHHQLLMRLGCEHRHRIVHLDLGTIYETVMHFLALFCADKGPLPLITLDIVASRSNWLIDQAPPLSIVPDLPMLHRLVIACSSPILSTQAAQTLTILDIRVAKMDNVLFTHLLTSLPHVSHSLKSFSFKTGSYFIHPGMVFTELAAADTSLYYCPTSPIHLPHLHTFRLFLGSGLTAYLLSAAISTSAICEMEFETYAGLIAYLELGPTNQSHLLFSGAYIVKECRDHLLRADVLSCLPLDDSSDSVLECSNVSQTMVRIRLPQHSTLTDGYSHTSDILFQFDMATPYTVTHLQIIPFKIYRVINQNRTLEEWETVFSHCPSLKSLSVQGILGHECNTSQLRFVSPLVQAFSAHALRSSDPDNEANVLCPFLQELKVAFIGKPKKNKSDLLCNGQNFSLGWIHGFVAKRAALGARPLQKVVLEFTDQGRWNTRDVQLYCGRDLEGKDSGVLEDEILDLRDLVPVVVAERRDGARNEGYGWTIPSV